MNNIDKLKSKVSNLREKSLDVRLAGLTHLIMKYLGDKTEDNKNSVRVYVETIIQPNELLDFFLDNMEELENVPSLHESYKDILESKELVI